MKKNNHGALYIGTSNIVVPGNKNSFPEKFRSGTRLHYYSTLFNTVELNSTFYKVPMVRTFEKWTHDVMPEFIFTVKLFNGITHIKNLVFDQSLVNTFLSAAAGMANRKGWLLIDQQDYFKAALFVAIRLAVPITFTAPIHQILI